MSSYPEEFLASFKEAIERADELEAAISWDGNGDPPPLSKYSSGWEVNPEEFERFKTVIRFLNETIFGRDCDRDLAVRYRFVNRKEDQTQLPSWTIPSWDKIDEGGLKELFAARQAALGNASAGQTQAEHLSNELDRKLREQFKNEE